MNKDTNQNNPTTLKEARERLLAKEYKVSEIGIWGGEERFYINGGKFCANGGVPLNYVADYQAKTFVHLDENNEIEVVAFVSGPNFSRVKSDIEANILNAIKN